MVTEIHVGDAGTAVRVHLIDQDKVDVDVSGASSVQLTFVSPTNRRLTVPAAQVTDGRDGRVQYVLGAEDFDVAGPWRLQTRVTFTNAEWNSNIVNFQVVGNL